MHYQVTCNIDTEMVLLSMTYLLRLTVQGVKVVVNTLLFMRKSPFPLALSQSVKDTISNKGSSRNEIIKIWPFFNLPTY